MQIRRTSAAIALSLMSLSAGWVVAQTTQGDDGLTRLDVIDEQILRAIQRKDTRKLDSAIEALEVRQRNTGADARSLVLLARAYLERSPNFYGRKAFQAAEQAIRLEPQNPSTHLAKASVGIQLDCVPCAQSAIEDAEKIGQPTPGIAAAKASVQLMKARAAAREPGSSAYTLSEEDARAQAGSYIRQAIAAETRPLHISALLVWQAQVTSDSDDVDASVRLLKRALEVDPENVTALRQYAKILTFNKGEIERAAKLVESMGDMGDSSLWAIKAVAPYVRWAKAWKEAPGAPETKALLEAAVKAAPEADEIFQIVSMQTRFAHVAEAMLGSGIYRIAPAEYRDKDGDTALANAVLNAGEGTPQDAGAKRMMPVALSVIDALLKAGANPNAWASRGREPIIAVAARNGDRALVDRLLAAGADAHAVASNGTTALLAAAQGDDHDAAQSIARLLVQRGVRIDSYDRFRHTPLMAAARGGNFELVCLLIEAGADATRKDIDGQTPLDWAAAGGHEGAAGALLAAGAEITETVDARGRLTTLDRAERSGNKSLVELLKKHQKKES